MFVSNKCNQYLNLMTGSRYRDLYTEITFDLPKVYWGPTLHIYPLRNLDLQLQDICCVNLVVSMGCEIKLLMINLFV
jgi:hypothetical protein